MQLFHCARVEFDATEGVIQNPYVGFVSFNHFRGGDLFSNSVDGKEKEKYPLYDYIEQNGIKEGFHPECEVAYIRILWKDFEPKEGEYNFAFIDHILDECAKHKQHLIFRIMPHTTRRDEDVPDWLKEQIDCPERPDDQRVKESPSSPIFLEKFIRMMKDFAVKYDSNPILYGIDVSLYGAWGEGEGYKTVDKALIDKLMHVYTDNFKQTFIFGQICAPELVAEANKNGYNLGFRGDGCGEPSHMTVSFPRSIYQMRDAYKTAPITFESFWHIAVWMEKGWDVEAIFEKSLSWHISTFNNKSSSIPYEYYKEVQKFIEKMGYRFAVRYLEYPDVAGKGDTLNCNMYVENRGNSPIYINHPLTFKLKNDKYEKVFNSDIDIRKWMPGDTVQPVSLTLPEDIPSGDYELSIGLVGEYPRPTIKFAFNTKEENGYYKLCDIKVK